MSLTDVITLTVIILAVLGIIVTSVGAVYNKEKLSLFGVFLTLISGSILGYIFLITLGAIVVTDFIG
jgi:hypothetical protein